MKGLQEINDLEAYNAQTWERHLENQIMHLAGIKGRYAYLNLEWTPEIEREAMRRDGGGITVYLQRIAEAQQEAFRQRLQTYGTFS